MSASIVVAWELGSGMGHIIPLLPLIRQLRQEGHRVSVITRDLSRVSEVFRGLDVTCFQAPLKNTSPAQRIEPPRSFAHILHNCGYADIDELQGLAEAWRNLYRLLSPDLVLCDHAPTAVLAARGTNFIVATTGIPFSCPPLSSPFPDLRSWLGDASAQLEHDEQAVLKRINQLLATWNQPPLEQLWKLFSEVDECFLATFRELDPYPDRGEARYWGAWPSLGGEPAVWPTAGRGKKIFAYLHQFPAFPHLFRMLRELRLPTLAYCDALPDKMRSELQCDTIRFADQRVSLSEAAKQCDLAILNAGHGTTAAMLLAGKPLLQIPLHLEQTHNGLITKRLGVAHSSDLMRPADIAAGLTALLNSNSFANEAQRIADRYVDFDPQLQLSQFAERINQLLAQHRERQTKADMSSDPTVIRHRNVASIPPGVRDEMRRRDTRPLVIGIGTGRCGMKSLSELLGRQLSSAISPESHLPLPWEVSDASMALLHRNLDQLVDRYPQVAFIGDVAHYYLPYVSFILESFPRARFVCLQRDRTETIESFVSWIAKTQRGVPVNPWSADRTGFDTTERDASYPKYATRNLPQAIGRYWTEYYGKAEEFVSRHPEQIRIFPAARVLNEAEEMRGLLDWVGIPRARQKLLRIQTGSPSHETVARRDVPVLR